MKEQQYIAELEKVRLSQVRELKKAHAEIKNLKRHLDGCNRLLKQAQRVNRAWHRNSVCHEAW